MGVERGRGVEGRGGSEGVKFTMLLTGTNWSFAGSGN